MTCQTCDQLPATLEAMVGWHHFHGPAPCWWWLREVYIRHLGYALPAETVLEPQAQWDALVMAGIRDGLFRRVLAPARYVTLLLRYPKAVFYHMGITLDHAQFLHVPTPAAGVTLSPIARHLPYLVGFYRYVQEGGRA